MQQFVLRRLYYCTPLPSVIDFIIIPWLGVLAAFAGSWLITHFLYKAKVGKYLF